MANHTTVNNGSDFPPPSNVDYYSINNPRVVALAQAIVGYRWHTIGQEYFPYSSLYLQYRHNFNGSIQGYVQQYSLPEFQNYKYRMNYQSNLLTLNAKFDLIEWMHIMPYLAGGAGFIVNSTNNYNEAALANVTPRFSPHFNGKSNTNWALTLGAGFDFILTRCLWLTLGYEHVFQGGNYLSSGSGTDSWSGTHLNFGSPKMDTVFLNLTVNLPQGMGN